MQAGAGAGSSAIPTGPFHAAVNYTRDTPVLLDSHSPDQKIIAVDAVMHDARAANPKFWEHGFQLLHHPTSLTKADFLNDAAVTSRYYNEMKVLVKRALGAAEVAVFHHMTRNASPSSSAKKPAGVVHCDYTSRSSVGIWDAHASGRMREGRYIVLNAWRNIVDTPIVNDHLAMCDARSVVAPDDFVKFMNVEPDGKRNATYRLDPSRSKLHQWYYFPGMRKQEVMLFLQYDSNPSTPTRYTFHSAVSDPRAPPGAPPRESIETRMIAFFPDHRPNTCPSIVMSDDDAVQHTYESMMNSLVHAQKWGAPGYNWMANVCREKDAMKKIWDGMSSSGKRDGHHGFKRLNDDQCRRVREKLVANQDAFLRRARTYFVKGGFGKPHLAAAVAAPSPTTPTPPPRSTPAPAPASSAAATARDTHTVAAMLPSPPSSTPPPQTRPQSSGSTRSVQAVVRNIFTMLEHPTRWPAPSRAWMAREIHTTTGVDSVIPILVSTGRERHLHGLERLTPEEVDSVIATLFSKSDEFLARARANFPR